MCAVGRPAHNREKEKLPNLPNLPKCTNALSENMRRLGLSMDHRDMRGETVEMAVGTGLSIKGCFYQTNPTEKCGSILK
jgi:hypothetical protein